VVGQRIAREAHGRSLDRPRCAVVPRSGRSVATPEGFR
jgi:hypothetical protein